MAMSKEQILAELKSLDPREREELMGEVSQLDDGYGLDADQKADLRRRVAELRRGEAKLLDGEQVMRDLLSELRGK